MTRFCMKFYPVCATIFLIDQLICILFQSVWQNFWHRRFSEIYIPLGCFKSEIFRKDAYIFERSGRL